jgi:hypothetical protein
MHRAANYHALYTFDDRSVFLEISGGSEAVLGLLR